MREVFAQLCIQALLGHRVKLQGWPFGVVQLPAISSPRHSLEEDAGFLSEKWVFFTTSLIVIT